MAAMMNSKSSSVSTVYSLVLVALEFFCKVGFVGETILFLEGSTSSIGSLGGVTFPCLCGSSFPLVPSLSTSSSPPRPSDFEAISYDVLLNCWTSSIFFLILIPCVSCSS
jgi:hypothetical protein